MPQRAIPPLPAACPRCSSKGRPPAGRRLRAGCSDVRDSWGRTFLSSLLFACSGRQREPFAGGAIGVPGVSQECTIQCPVPRPFAARFRMPLPLAPRNCACHGQFDSPGEMCDPATGVRTAGTPTVRESSGTSSAHVGQLFTTAACNV